MGRASDETLGKCRDSNKMYSTHSRERVFQLCRMKKDSSRRAVVFLHSMTPEEHETWARALSRFRAEKDEFFRTDHRSPLNGTAEGFHPLNYFDPDPLFRSESKIHRYANPEAVVVSTSKGTRQLFNRVGYFDLTVGGALVRIHAYQSAERDDPSLFLPFRDATSGKESYGAARYLDMEVEHNDEYAVDFNYAYNPYCAYSEDYVCPLPPHENWLSAAIRAGEKKYHE